MDKKIKLVLEHSLNLWRVLAVHRESAMRRRPRAAVIPNIDDATCWRTRHTLLSIFRIWSCYPTLSHGIGCILRWVRNDDATTTPLQNTNNSHCFETKQVPIPTWEVDCTYNKGDPCCSHLKHQIANWLDGRIERECLKWKLWYSVERVAKEFWHWRRVRGKTSHRREKNTAPVCCRKREAARSRAKRAW